MINVNGRLHSTEKGVNVIAGANEIFDDDKNKKQGQINTETYSLVNDINERLSGLSPDQQGALSVAAKATNNEAKLGYYVCGTESNVAAKVIPDATGYVLSNGGSIKVKMTNANSANNATLNINSTGAKPLYYGGERASANNTWEEGEIVDIYYNGENYYANNVAGENKFLSGEKVKEVGIDNNIVNGSNNLVKSGVIYNEFALAGVYDISAKNPTAGPNNDGKFTLEYILNQNNVNTLIPTSVRKGGMSIKFVQSSDNKYMQYFLTKDEWSASEADWEKMNLEEEVSQLGQELSIEIAKLNSAPNIKQVDIKGTSAQNTSMTLLSGEKYLIQCSCPGADNATLNNSGLYYKYGSDYIKAFDADKSMFNNGFVCVLSPSNDTNLYVRTNTAEDVVDITLWNITNIEEKASKQESIFAAIASEAYRYSDLTYNDSGMPTSGEIIWPDGRTGGIIFYYNNSGVLFMIQYTIRATNEKYRQDFSYGDDGSFVANTIYKVNN